MTVAEATQRVQAAIGESDTRTPDRLRRVAVHEAGHAIVATLLGVEVASATIRRQAGMDGHVVPVPPFDHEQALTLYLAGPVAESMAFRTTTKCEATWSGDRQRVLEALAERCGREPKRPFDLRIFTTCRDRAAELLVEHWPAVVHVASLLLTHRTIKGATVKATVAMFTSRRRTPTPTISNWSHDYAPHRNHQGRRHFKTRQRRKAAAVAG